MKQDQGEGFWENGDPKPYGLKRHNAICDELESKGYTEKEIVIASVGIWKGIESEKNHQADIAPLHVVKCYENNFATYIVLSDDTVWRKEK